jgi:hypothetical protein
MQKQQAKIKRMNAQSLGKNKIYWKDVPYEWDPITRKRKDFPPGRKENKLFGATTVALMD